MKINNWILLLFLLIVGKISAQDSLFIRSYGLPGYNYGEKVMQLADSAFIILGNKNGFIGNTDIYLVRTNKFGNLVWDKAYGGVEVNWAEDLIKTYDNGYVIAGYMSIPENNNDYNIMLLKTDSAGNLQWMKNFGGNDWDLAHSLVETPDSGFMITGETYSYENGNNDIFLLKTNKNGDSLWMKNYGGLKMDIGHDISSCDDGNFIITACTNSFGHGGYDAYILKISPEGDTIWTKTIGDTLDDKAFAGIETFDHNFVFTGSTYNYNALALDGLLLKTDSVGHPFVHNVYGGNTNEEFYDIAENSKHQYIMAGYSESYGYGGSQDFYVVLTDIDGWFITGPTYGYEGIDAANACTTTITNGFAVTGTSESLGPGLTNILLVKFDSIGGTKISSYIHIADITENTSTENIINIYPNPASDNIIISINDKIKPDEINIIDSFGRIVKSVYPESLTETSINLSDLPKGIFLLLIKEKNNQIIKKIIHL
jgi:hypothetical protein